MIAGAVILAFFLSLAMRARESGQQEAAIEVSNAVAAAFTGALQSPDAFNNQTSPLQGISFECSPSCECNFYIDPDGVRKATSFGEKIIMAPPALRDRPLQLWTIPWALPLRAANMLIVSNEDYHLYIVHDDGDVTSSRIFARINKSLPRDFGAQHIAPDDVMRLEDTGYPSYRFVFLSLDPQQYVPRGLRDAEDLSAVKIDDTGAAFYEFDGGAWQRLTDVPYPAQHYPSAMAAMFARDPAMFACGMRNAYRKLSFISRIQHERTIALSAAPELQQNGCSYLAEWDKMGAAASSLSRSTQFNDADLSALDAAVRSVELENRRLLDIGPTKCPSMY